MMSTWLDGDEFEDEFFQYMNEQFNQWYEAQLKIEQERRGI